MNDGASRSEETLEALLRISSELENMVVESSFRFGATGAYEALVHQRIDVLREARFNGRQTLHEFMMRRFDPAMRTVKSAEGRLAKMAERAMRAGQLLSTRVDVERSAQNQELLASMDKRADLQLRLQHTVEGLVGGRHQLLCGEFGGLSGHALGGTCGRVETRRHGGAGARGGAGGLGDGAADQGEV